MITDHQFTQFMDTLLADQRGKNPLVLGEWESNFVAGYARAARRSLWFTPGRRQATDRMWRKWGPDLGFPHPADLVSPVTCHPSPASPTGCEYMVPNEEGGPHRQRRCNEPAAFQDANPPKLRYCQMHADMLDRAFKQRGKTILLRKFEQPSNEGTK